MSIVNLISHKFVLAAPLESLLCYQARVARPLALVGHFREVELICKAVVQLVVGLLLEVLEVILEPVVTHG